MRRAARTDGNHAAVIKRLREYGCSVADTSRLGGGFPDIVVGWRKESFLFEIKDPAKPPSKRKLTQDEEDFAKAWKGQYDVVETAEEALKIMQEATL